MRVLKEIIVHCTATPAARALTVPELRRWHIERGFADIGYHFIVHQDGTVSEARPLSQIGAHCAGYNKFSIGVAYVGGISLNGLNIDTRTDAQRASMSLLIVDLMHKYGIRSVVGHNYYNPNKSCPCFDAKAEYADVLNK